MTEQEYINVRNLSSVLTAMHALSDIVHENQPLISREAYVLVLRTVSGWQDALFKSVTIDENPPPNTND